MRRWMMSTMVIVLVACGSAAPTEVPPTAIPTPVPLADIDLEPFLIQSGDLPSGYDGSQVFNEAPAMFDKAPHPINAINQRFEHKDETAGGVSVLLYESTDDVKKAYDVVVDGLVDDLIVQKPELGEGGVTSVIQIQKGLSFSEGAFHRCHAVVHVRFTINDERAVESYLERLDKRLQPLVCQ